MQRKLKYLGPIACATLPVATPLVLVLFAAYSSEWFNLVENALSDLGHAIKSSAAPIFNTGLSLGGLFIAIGAVKYLSKLSRTFSLLMLATGYSLILVAVFDEVYGELHFHVSVLFFIMLFLSTLYYVLRVAGSRRLQHSTLVLLAIAVAFWVLHFAYRTPRGAAIPELVSILAVLPAYTHAYVQVVRVSAHAQSGSLE